MSFRHADNIASPYPLEKEKERKKEKKKNEIHAGTASDFKHALLISREIGLSRFSRGCQTTRRYRCANSFLALENFPTNDDGSWLEKPGKPELASLLRLILQKFPITSSREVYSPRKEADETTSIGSLDKQYWIQTSSQSP
ncbi:hypothetical protein K0M31_012185 [Melipona bicolor]|uniref:Uncharacterized protein n=1 Tax=Melipona bicolor TaxID=60889 RepID=A0AA40KHL3_9HYME|nr:hypothetical protein K0M31_012185 [Melipona bicolor]